MRTLQVIKNKRAMRVIMNTVMLPNISAYKVWKRMIAVSIKAQSRTVIEKK